MARPIDNWRRALNDLIVARFSDPELRSLVGLDLPELAPSLPGPAASLDELASGLILTAIRQGSVGDLLDSLERARPNFVDELREIRELWIAAQESRQPRINRTRSVTAALWIAGVTVALALQALKPLAAAPSLRLVADVASALALVLVLTFVATLWRGSSALGRVRRSAALALILVGGTCGFSLLQRRAIDVQTLHLRPADDLFTRERGTPLNDTDTNQIKLESITADVREGERVVYVRIDASWYRDRHSWFERQYRGDILYRADLDEGPDGAPVLGELELLDYSLSPTSKLQSYVLGFFEVDVMMTRHRSRIARALQLYRANQPFVPAPGG